MRFLVSLCFFVVTMVSRADDLAHDFALGIPRRSKRAKKWEKDHGQIPWRRSCGDAHGLVQTLARRNENGK